VVDEEIGDLGEAERLGGSSSRRRRIVGGVAALAVAAVVVIVVLIVNDSGGSALDDSSPMAAVESYGNAVISGDDAVATRLTCDELLQSPSSTDELEGIEGFERSVHSQMSEMRATSTFPEGEDQERVSGEYHMSSGDETATGQFEAIAIRNPDSSWSFCGFEVFGPPVIDN
jgi:hypothetical protein